ncbi:hypothetical protein OG756_01170 [Streptomyces sp. NBC_01310]|uniref:hypothetical protein n=1 Tax=Streptomyces sp. NBC_01310 TaxID=2903820 RepID=UPI0035B58E5E|nr:hypothetical protein OG756_01170 [Streptomyces sp. NBC_01310]
MATTRGTEPLVVGQARANGRGENSVLAPADDLAACFPSQWPRQRSVYAVGRLCLTVLPSVSVALMRKATPLGA